MEHETCHTAQLSKSYQPPCPNILFTADLQVPLQLQSVDKIKMDSYE